MSSPFYRALLLVTRLYTKLDRTVKRVAGLARSVSSTMLTMMAADAIGAGRMQGGALAGARNAGSRAAAGAKAVPKQVRCITHARKMVGVGSSLHQRLAIAI